MLNKRHFVKFALLIFSLLLVFTAVPKKSDAIILPGLKYLASEVYKEDKYKGTKTNKHTTTTGSLPTKSDKYSSKDKVKSGKVITRKYYNKDGKADMDIDYTDHGNPKLHPKVPHRHNWTWKGNTPTRGKGY